MSHALLSKSALTKIQASVIVAVILVAVIAGGYYYWTTTQKPIKSATVFAPRTEIVTNLMIGVVFSINVSVRNVVDVHNWTFSLSFDPAVLKTVEINEGDFLKAAGGATTFNPGTIGNGVIEDFSSTLTDTRAATSGNGTLATIAFNTTKDIGFCPLTLKNVKLLNTQGQPTPCEVVSGSFSTIPWKGMAPSDFAGTLNVFEWGTYENPKLWNAGPYAFNRLYPKIEVRFTFFVDESEALTKLQTGFKPDIVHPCGQSIRRWVDAGVIEPLNITLIPLWQNMTNKFKTFDQNFVNGVPYFQPTDWGYTTVMYRPDLLEQMGIPKINPDTGENQWDTYNLLFDPKDGKMKQKIAILDSAVEMFPQAAAAAGINYTQVWNMTPAQLDLAKQKFVVQKQGQMIRFYWKVPSDTIKAMQTGEIVAANIWGEEYVVTKSAGVNVTFSFPKEGIFAWVCGFSVVKGLKEKNSELYKIVHAYMNAWIQPEAGANLIDLLGYGTPNKDAAKIAKNQDTVELLGFDDPATLDKVHLYKYAPNEPDWAIIYLEVKSDP